MVRSLRVVSHSPNSMNFRFFVGDEELTGIKKVEFSDLYPNDVLTVKLELIPESIDIIAYEEE